jgi:hypothetical protein
MAKNGEKNGQTRLAARQPRLSVRGKAMPAAPQIRLSRAGGDHAADAHPSVLKLH